MEKVCFWRKQNWESCIIILSLFLLPFLYFCPILFSESLITSSDGIGYEAQFKFIRDCIHNSTFPLWNDLVGNGTPFVADIQNKVFYPLVYLCLIFPTHLDFKIFYLLHISIASISAYLLCRACKFDKPLGIFGGLVFGFSNMMLLRYCHINILCVISWIPLLMCFVVKLANTNDPKFRIWIALVLTLQFMAGFPQTAVYCDMYMGLIFLYLSFVKKRKIKNIILDLVVIVTIFVGLSSVQILPLIELMKFSERNNITYEYFASYSADIKMLLNLLNPLFLGSANSVLTGRGFEFPTDMYIGIVAFTLFFYGICRHFKTNHIIRGILSIGFFFFILACACSNIPLLGKMLYHIPLIGSFRATIRFTVFFIAAVIFVAVYSLNIIYKEGDWKNYLKSCNIVITLYLAIVLILHLAGYFNLSSEIANNYYLNTNVYWVKGLVTLFVFCMILRILLYFSTKVKLFLSYIPVFMALFTIFDIYYINKDPWADAYRMPAITRMKNHEETFGSGLVDFMNSDEEMELYNYYVSYDKMYEDMARTNLGVRANGNIFNGLKTIQSYITFNNPTFGALCTATPGEGQTINNATALALTNPSLISMLSVRYIIQPYQILYEEITNTRIDSSAASYELPFDVFENEDYLLNIHVNSNIDSGELILADENNIMNTFKITSLGDSYFSFGFNGTDLIGNELVIKSDNSDLTIRSIRLERVGYKMDLMYDRVYDDGAYRIYKNERAMPLVYATSKVRWKEDAIPYVLENKQQINFVNESIVEADENGEYNLSATETSIDIINVTNNGVKALVHARGGNIFINYSQNFYPGWVVYCDGVKRKSVCVNGVIQGVEVPEGEYIVEFRYEPLSLALGLMISLSTSVFLLVWIVYKYRVKRKRIINLKEGSERKVYEK
ncbi:MAG: hypothetical protein ACRDBO_02865 [Lachnospiraceae bacterium]